MEFSSRVISGVLIAGVLLSLLGAGCTASKESTIRCTKCGASPAELQKQYDQKTKNR